MTSICPRIVCSLCAFALTFTLGLTASGETPTPPINYPGGFNDVSGLQLNGSATVQGNAIQLTDGKQNEAGSFFSKQRLLVQEFTTSFDFQLTDATADGFTFTVQTLGADALGSAGGGLGYGNPPGGTGQMIGIADVPYQAPTSLALAFDLHNNLGEGNNSLYVEGNGITKNPGIPYTVDLTTYGLNLHSGHRFHADLELGPFGFNVALTDTQTNVSVTIEIQNIYAIALQGYGYAGFTGGTGDGTATQTIYNWTYTPIPPTPTYNSQFLFPTGFAGQSLLSLNNGATVSDSTLEMAHGKQFEATSALSIPLAVNAFAFITDFDFDLGDGNGDGFTFISQTYHHTAVGSSGGGLGYGPDKPGGAGASIPSSMAVKFDLHNDAGEGDNSTGLYFNGASPTTPAVDLTSSGLNLHSGHLFHARISCDPQYGQVNVTIVDLTAYKTFRVHLPNTAFYYPQYSSFGFTAGTGATPGVVNIYNWTLATDLIDE